MNFDDSFSKRVAIARSALGLTQAELAQQVGIVPRQIAAYEGGEAKPRDKTLKNLAAALNSSISWLMTGKGPGPDTSHIQRTITVREVPILTPPQIMGIGFDFDNFRKSSSASDFIPAPLDAGEYAFALEVRGDSMQSSGTPSFPDGSLIVVDPDITPEAGDFGLFLSPDDDGFTFKQFILDQGKGYLKPLNPLYPMISVPPEPNYIGKVIASQQFFKNKKTLKTTSYNTNTMSNQSIDLVNYETRLSSIEDKLDAILDLLTSNKKPT